MGAAKNKYLYRRLFLIGFSYTAPENSTWNHFSYYFPVHYLYRFLKLCHYIFSLLLVYHSNFVASYIRETSITQVILTFRFCFKSKSSAKLNFLRQWYLQKFSLRKMGFCLKVKIKYKTSQNFSKKQTQCFFIKWYCSNNSNEQPWHLSFKYLAKLLKLDQSNFL